MSLADICHSPLKPSVDICNIQSIWAYWQDDPNQLEAEAKRLVSYIISNRVYFILSY